MPRLRPSFPLLRLRGRLRPLLCAAFCLAGVLTVQPASAQAPPLASTLNAMEPALRQSTLGRPLVIQAKEGPNGLQGDVFAIIEHTPADIARQLSTPAAWCAAMMLHLDNRTCEVGAAGSSAAITLGVVRRYDQPASSASRIIFNFSLPSAGPRYFDARLTATAGPFGTSDYRIRLEAIPVGDRRSFVHFAYAYRTSTWTDVALQAYLSTFGRSKVGFTQVGTLANGAPDHVRGAQGLLERNAMRYFLAVDAFLDADTPLARQNAWYASSERYPRQLHEVDRPTYLRLKGADAAGR